MAPQTTLHPGIPLNAAIQGGQQLYDLGMLISSGQFDITNPDHLSMITSTVQSFYTAGPYNVPDQEVSLCDFLAAGYSIDRIATAIGIFRLP